MRSPRLRRITATASSASNRSLKAGDGSLRVLDLADPDVRAAVMAFEGAKVTALYESEHSQPYG